jgi:hypothetical protein
MPIRKLLSRDCIPLDCTFRNPQLQMTFLIAYSIVVNYRQVVLDEILPQGLLSTGATE